MGFKGIQNMIILGMFQSCFKWISRKLQGCFKEVFRVFQGSFRKFPGCFEKVSRVFQLRLKDLSSTLRGFEGYLKEV